ncbi:hypothetical protein AB0F91_41530 [Amycolatopsis sp. NPDC023774]
MQDGYELAWRLALVTDGRAGARRRRTPGWSNAGRSSTSPSTS